MWYGEPLIEPAAVACGHVTSSATWPPQAITTSGLEAVNVTVIDCCSPATSLAPPSEASVIVPFQIVNAR